MERAYNNLQAELGACSSALAAKEAANADLTGQLGQSEQALSAARSEAASLRTSAALASSSEGSLASQLRGKQERCDRLLLEADELRGELARATQAADAERRQRASARAQEARQAAQLVPVGLELERVRKEREVLARRAAELEREAEQTAAANAEQRRAASAAAIAAQADASDLRARVAALQASKDEQGGRLDAEQREADELSKQLRSARSEQARTVQAYDEQVATLTSLNGKLKQAKEEAEGHAKEHRRSAEEQAGRAREGARAAEKAREEAVEEAEASAAARIEELEADVRALRSGRAKPKPGVPEGAVEIAHRIADDNMSMHDV
jgi:colicin import membrane protein